MSSVIRYADSFSDEYTNTFKDAPGKENLQDLKITNVLDIKRTSTFESYANVAKCLCRFKTIMT